MMRILSPLVLAFFLGCSAPQVAIRKDFDFDVVRRVAMLTFSDYPKIPGSGQIVSSTFEKTLLMAGYQLIERRQVDEVLKERHLNASLDPKAVRALGESLGVDAVVLGNLTAFTPEKKNVMLVDVNDDEQQPIVRKEFTHDSAGNVTERDVVTGFKTIHHHRKVPEELDTDAEVGISARMVLVKTGEVLWSASWSKSASNVEQASEVVSERIMRALKPAWRL